MEHFDLNEIRSLSRESYHDTWLRVKAGKELEGEEKIIGELMRQHEEFYDDWDSTDFDHEYDPDTEVNPFMHLVMDTIVMNQITNNDPPQTRFTYNKLTARRDSHLDAIHKISYIVAEEIWNIMHDKKAFNEKAYTTKLKKLKWG